MQVKVKKLREDAVIPKFATSGAACFDLVALDSEGLEVQAEASEKALRCCYLNDSFKSAYNTLPSVPDQVAGNLYSYAIIS